MISEVLLCGRVRNLGYSMDRMRHRHVEDCWRPLHPFSSHEYPIISVFVRSRSAMANQSNEVRLSSDFSQAGFSRVPFPRKVHLLQAPRLNL